MYYIFSTNRFGYVIIIEGRSVAMEITKEREVDENFYY